MSKIVSPYPPLNDADIEIPRGARWWRLLLEPNGDDIIMVTRTDADDESDPTWVEWEFFDGDNTILDAGMDKPTMKFVMSVNGLNRYLDVLSVDPPTKCPRWRAISFPTGAYGSLAIQVLP